MHYFMTVTVAVHQGWWRQWNTCWRVSM